MKRNIIDFAGFNGLRSQHGYCLHSITVQASLNLVVDPVSRSASVVMRDGITTFLAERTLCFIPLT